MSRAVALLLTRPLTAGACPPGVPVEEFGRALAEDVVDLLADLPGLDPVLAVAAPRRADAEAVRWPGTPMLDLPAGAGPVAVLAELAAAGWDQAAVLAPDAPDLPGLLLAKPFSALERATVAAVPAENGGLVALAARLPPPDWLAADLDLDDVDAPARLRAAAPRRRDLAVTPGWHRLRAPVDLRRLDPGLEGWERTRLLVT